MRERGLAWSGSVGDDCAACELVARNRAEDCHASGDRGTAKSAGGVSSRQAGEYRVRQHSDGRERAGDSRGAGGDCG